MTSDREDLASLGQKHNITTVDRGRKANLAYKINKDSAHSLIGQWVCLHESITGLLIGCVSSDACFD